MANIETLKKIAKISKYIGFTSLCYILNKGRKRTIAYHNIIPDKYWDEALHLAHSMKESSFERQLEVIGKRFGYSLEIEDANKVTLTFDDGYLNQYLIASKKMDDKDIQGYFFCPSNMIIDNKTLIIDNLQLWFSYVPYGSYNIEDINIRLDIKDKESRINEWKKIVNLMDKIDGEKIEKLLNGVYEFNKIKIDNDFYSLRFLPIKTNQLSEMKNKGHKIGAHSASHKRLSNMNSEELNNDISICRSMLDEIYNTNIFCYPFGSVQDINHQVINTVRSKGFTKAFAYSNGYIKEGYNDYFIPRMFLPDTDDESVIDFALSGAKHFLSFKKLLPKY